ncbi:adherens junction-associated protein 1 isoform X1 [Monodelphis domestica]|uniref:Adherens junctions associated protein 1 n=1 Tax=Monodelphis domestica TaxID=13616 RepID=F7EYW1_MONDO|nr:adherens junction-associated protein 1 isoform X1 [Monodelphis domestica]
MWIKQLLGISSMSVHWSGCPIGSHAWILIAMFQLAMDFPTCESLAQGPEFRLLPRPFHNPRLWSFKSGLATKVPTPLWNLLSSHPERAHGQIQKYHSRGTHRTRNKGVIPLKSGSLKHPEAAKFNPSIPSLTNSGRIEQQTPLRRDKRHLQGGSLNNFDFRGSKPTVETEFIAWGPTGEEESVESSTSPGIYGPTTVSILQTRKTTVATTTTTTTSYITRQPKGFTPSLSPVISQNSPNYPGRISTTESSPGPQGNGKDITPPRILGETSGLAVHQIITITVSLIMVIAALITTLVLKNCCAQSGNTRRNSHQRKINQQEESCQNLTDFTPARVPSNLDIFTAYNETLQCSHECVRTSVPVYTDETLHPTGEYKTTFNGNRPSSSDRHLIPVAFVSEKWFEISC